MSWMDWGSRPKKSAATPPPLYLVAGADQVRYCHTCGRVIGSRKSQSAKAAANTTATQVKFCSDRCKRHKLRPADRRLEEAFALLLNAQDASHLSAIPPGLGVPSAAEPHSQETPGTHSSSSSSSKDKDTKAKQPHDKYNYRDKGKKKIKGDPRIIVSCSEVETLVFGSREDPDKVFGRKKNRARRGVADGEWKSVDMDSDTDAASVEGSAGEDSVESVEADAEEGTDGGVPLTGRAARVRKPQAISDVNGSVGGEKGWAERIDETPEMLVKRREGQRRAEEKEMVKCAARRAVVFGLIAPGGDDREDRKDKGKGRNRGDGDEGDEGTGEQRRLCEAVMNGAVVEPSYAKGDWGIRWRET